MIMLLTQIIKAPLGTEAHLPLDVVLRVHPFLQTQEGVPWLGLQARLNHYFVLTCVEKTISALSQNIKQTKHHSKVTGTHDSYLSSHMLKSWSRDQIMSTECLSVLPGTSVPSPIILSFYTV